MKTVIIGNRGSGAYVFFRHLIFKEESKNFIVVDKADNKKIIELENKEKFKSLFCNYIEDYKEITYRDIKKYNADKIYINEPEFYMDYHNDHEFLMDYHWSLAEFNEVLFNEVLRIQLNNLTLPWIRKLNEFDKIFIFNPCDEFAKNYLSNIFYSYKKEILSFSDNRNDEYIMIANGEIKHTFLELDKNFKIDLV